ncbi:hypothetical protein [Rhodoligotrophos appendicifer]|uniref:hypothetical protein n=1 Tax=Rhodoligotrophos appendicifer TaxID=987056 RepID=UPI001184D580|nr:hypothetical protein [Rhodoligotrophos appendicifer]
MVYLETIMLIALGFVLASLFALFLLRIVWHHGERTGRRRVQSQFPTTSEELRADRARLRAELAMLVRKTELRIEDFKLQLIERDREIALTRARMEEIGQELSQRDDQLGKLRGGRLPLEEELAERSSALQSLQRTARDYLDQIQRLTREVEAAHATIKDRERLISDLKRGSPRRNDAPAARGHAPEIPNALLATEEHLREKIATIDALTRDLSTRRADAQALPIQNPDAGQAHTEAERRRLAGTLDEAERMSRHLIRGYGELRSQVEQAPPPENTPPVSPEEQRSETEAEPNAEDVVAGWAKSPPEEAADPASDSRDTADPGDEVDAAVQPGQRSTLTRLKAKSRKRRTPKRDDEDASPDSAEPAQ